MSTTERIAYTGGLAAAAGAGFMIGYSGNLTNTYYANRASEAVGIPEEHRWIGSIGWAAGVLVRGITYIASSNNKNSDDEP